MTEQSLPTPASRGFWDSIIRAAYVVIGRMFDDLPALFESPKTFPIRPECKPRDQNWLRCVQSLDIDGVTIEGLQFRATALLTRADASVTFQLEYYPPRRQPKGGPLARIEWRPVTAHNNKGKGPRNLQHVIQRGTHHHLFEENWRDDPDGVRKGELPISIPIDPEPSWHEVLAIVGKEFRISPIDWVPNPPWKPVLV